MARLSINICAGCNEERKINKQGFHHMKDGTIHRCEFVVEELRNVNVNLLSLFTTSLGAKRAYNRWWDEDKGVSILWTGQMPVSNNWPKGFFMVVESNL